MLILFQGDPEYGINKVTLDWGKGFKACRSFNLDFAIQPNVFSKVLLRGIGN